MQYNLHDYIEKVAAEIHRLGLERNTANERVTEALKKSTGKFEEAEAFTSVVERAVEVDKMYAYYSSRMGELKKQEQELIEAERQRDEIYKKYVEKVRLHMQMYSGMQASPDVMNYQGMLNKAIERVNMLSTIEVEDRYSL